MVEHFTVIGVHPILLDSEILADAVGTRLRGWATVDQMESLLHELMTEFRNTVLIEAKVAPVDARLDRAAILQPGRAEEWCAWEPRFLSPDGRQVVSEWEPPKGAQQVRMTFFIHLFDPALPLITPCGVVELPEPAPMPARLMEIAPYVVID